MASDSRPLRLKDSLKGYIVLIRYTEKSNDLIQSNDSFMPQKPCDICDKFPFINS